MIISILITLICPIPPEPLISHQSPLTFLPLSLCDLLSLIRAVSVSMGFIYQSMATCIDYSTEELSTAREASLTKAKSSTIYGNEHK